MVIMKNVQRKFKIILYLLLLVLLSFITIKLRAIYNENKVENMNSTEAIKDFCSNRENMALTIGILYEGQMYYTVYGENAEVLPKEIYSYEIASITKTFTASLLSKAVSEGKINLEDSISQYMKLDENQYYPTVKQLATHTAGYGGYPLPIWFNEVKSLLGYPQNPFYGVDNEELTEYIQKKKLSDKQYDYKYSNFGFAVLGNVLSNVYEEDFDTLLSKYIQDELGLTNTYIGTKQTELIGITKSGKNSNWEWESDDSYLSAGSLISNIEDMLRYVEIQMSEEKDYLSISHQKYAQISDRSAIGLGWFIDEGNNIISHSGATGGFSSFIGYDKVKNIAVVVMANYESQTYKNSTIIGYKILHELQDGNNVYLYLER